VSAGSRRVWWLGAAGLIGVVAIAITWPLFRHPGTQVLDSPSLYGPASELVQRDINLTMWVLAWDSHALVTDPLHLFHANSFYPARWSLALSEHMLGNTPVFTPVYLASRNPVLAHQAALLATFVVAGLTMAAYVHHWTRDRAAALAAGCLFAFAPYRLWQLGNLHVISIHWMPLVLLGIDLALDGRRRAGGALLGLGLALSTLCSYYVGYTTFALGGAYGLVALATRRRRAVPALPALGLGFGGAALVVGVLTVPYVLLQREGVIPHRDRAEDLESMAFVWLAMNGPLAYTSYFFTPRRDGIPQFLGSAVLALAAAGVVLRRHPPRGALLAGGVTGWLLSLGPILSLADGRQLMLPYRWLMEVVPGFSAMRIPQRFGALATVAATALAGLGLGALRARLAQRGRAGLAAAGTLAAVALALGEARTPGLRTTPVPVGPTMPAAHRWLAEHGDGGALIEVPASDGAPLLQSIAMYQSTAHWLPIANGYSPYVPATFTAFMQAAARLPDPAALDRLLAVAPLRWVLVRWRLVGRANQPAWRATFEAAGLRVAGEFDEMTVFEVPPGRRRGAS
jgi:hypothetical protein